MQREVELMQHDADAEKLETAKAGGIRCYVKNDNDRDITEVSIFGKLDDASLKELLALLMKIDKVPVAE